MVFAHVIYKKTGLERKNVTVKAYNLIKNQYTLLGWVDEHGNPVEGPEQQQAKSTKTQKKSVTPVVNEPRRQMTADEIEAKKAELRALNDTAIQKAKDEQAKQEAEKAIQTPFVVRQEEQPVKQRKKPGPKPKSHA